MARDLPEFATNAPARLFSIIRLAIFTMGEPHANSRRPWLAAILSLLCGGPVGQVYAGRLRRGVCLWLLGASALPVVAVLAMFLPLGRIGLMVSLVCMVAYPVFLALDAYFLARRNRNPPVKRYQKWWVYIVLSVGFILASNLMAIVVKAYVAEAFVVPTRSMSPTILPGERILVDKLWSNRKSVQRNDVLVFRSRGPDSSPFVMRVVGMPGETLEIKNERIFINGAEWSNDQHAVFDGPAHPELVNYGPVQVPQDCYFFLGDHRRRSNDSRFIGCIPVSDLQGKARLIYWSWERVFPDPDDTSRFVRGPIHWDRIGKRLD